MPSKKIETSSFDRKMLEKAPLRDYGFHKIFDVTTEDGRICLGFGWFYPEYPHSSEPVQNKFDYYNNFLSYYVSEKGIALSYLGWENAQKEAEAIEGLTN